MPGWLVATEGKLTVALDITVTPELRDEGVARELVNRIQNIRKEAGFMVTDKIRVEIAESESVRSSLAAWSDYIAVQTQAVEVRCVETPQGEKCVETDIDDVPVLIAVTRL